MLIVRKRQLVLSAWPAAPAARASRHWRVDRCNETGPRLLALHYRPWPQPVEVLIQIARGTLLHGPPSAVHALANLNGDQAFERQEGRAVAVPWVGSRALAIRRGSTGPCPTLPQSHAGGSSPSMGTGAWHVPSHSIAQSGDNEGRVQKRTAIRVSVGPPCPTLNTVVLLNRP